MSDLNSLIALNFNHLCRTCLINTENLSEIISIKQFDDIKFIHALQECTSIHVSLLANLSNYFVRIIHKRATYMKMTQTFNHRKATGYP